MFIDSGIPTAAIDEEALRKGISYIMYNFLISRCLNCTAVRTFAPGSVFSRLAWRQWSSMWTSKTQDTRGK